MYLYSFFVDNTIMAKQKVTIAVDLKFFNNVFEKERQNMRDQIGLDNLSQTDFSSMIQGFKMRKPKIDLSKLNTRMKVRKNVKL